MESQWGNKSLHWQSIKRYEQCTTIPDNILNTLHPLSFTTSWLDSVWCYAPTVGMVSHHMKGRSRVGVGSSSLSISNGLASSSSLHLWSQLHDPRLTDNPLRKLQKLLQFYKQQASLCQIPRLSVWCQTITNRCSSGHNSWTCLYKIGTVRRCPSFQITPFINSWNCIWDAAVLFQGRLPNKVAYKGVLPQHLSIYPLCHIWILRPNHGDSLDWLTVLSLGWELRDSLETALLCFD